MKIAPKVTREPLRVEATAMTTSAPVQQQRREVHVDGHDQPGDASLPSTTALKLVATASASDLEAAQRALEHLGSAASSDAKGALSRVQKGAVELPIRAKLATSKSANRTPGEVPGIVREREGRITFYPADESLVPVDLDAAVAKGLPRNVLLVARATKKKLEVVGTDGSDVVATVYKLQREREAKLFGKLTGIVDHVDGAAYLRDIATGKLHPLEGAQGSAAREGAVLGAHAHDGKLVIDGVLAEGGTAEARSWSIAATQHLEPAFPDAAIAEAKAFLAAPGLDDPSLRDLRSEPFFAIDNHGSKDIDQAMRLTRRPDGGFVLQYALADMAHAVKPGMALWDEAMHRGASFYLPGINVPMQPREICEQGVSLNAHEDHRAVVVTIELDASGNVEKTASERALIHSRAQLTYPGVSAHLEGKTKIDTDDHGAKVGPDVTQQLDTFRALGEALQKQAHARGVVDPERREMRIGLDGAKFFLHEVESDLASGLNAQLSIVANCAAASMLADTGIPGIEAPAIFRVHPPPSREKLDALRRQLAAIVEANGAPASWQWRADEALNDWVERMRLAPKNEREHQLSQALQMQVLGIQVSSEYAREPDVHSGLMVKGYGRFTAPMREVVGLLSHATLMQLDSLKRVRALGIDDNELPRLWSHMLHGAIVGGDTRAAELEKLRGPALLQAVQALLPTLGDVDTKAVDAVFEKALASGNGSRMKQKQCDNASLKLLFDDLFVSDLQSAKEAPVRAGTVTSVSPGKVTVLLGEPDVEVKLTRDDLGGDAYLDKDGAELCCGHKRVLVGSRVHVQATHHDGDKLHFAIV